MRYSKENIGLKRHFSVIHLLSNIRHEIVSYFLYNSVILPQDAFILTKVLLFITQYYLGRTTPYLDNIASLKGEFR
jgi:hypothetical protein